MHKFYKLIEDQFKYGGVKYKNSGEKEVTDILTEDYGLNGLLWCINKYVYRFKNLRREKDLLKIATYMYILWLKYGYHQKKFDKDATVCTTVDVKSKYFPNFIFEVNTFEDTAGDFLKSDDIYDALTENLRSLRTPISEINDPTFIPAIVLFDTVVACKNLWESHEFSGKDTDTWNENKESESNERQKT